MSALLFEPITINGVEFRNRIAMSPMCMHSASDDGKINDFHVIHYGARALGGAGLIMLETASVLPNGPIGPGDIGIWDDSHIEGLSRVPQAMSIEQINEVVEAFRQGARRAREAGFDVIEIHGAHGYLLNQFLSPLANKRTDEYGGSHENRYRIVREVIDVVRSEWKGPLFLRISSTDYVEGGNRPEDFLIYGNWMKEQGIDLIDYSSGGIAMVQVNTYPNYQVPAAELLRRELDIKTGAVGLIETGRQAEEILQNGRADIILVGRDMLKDPFWARTAADDLNVVLPVPAQYTRYGSGWQRSQPRLPAADLASTVEQ